MARDIIDEGLAQGAPSFKQQSFKPHLSFLQIVNMSFGFFGIQFGFALQNANTSYIFSSLGASPDELPILWIAAPVTGLLVQPIIGYYSDRTWHRKWGRRRPYFALGALLASIALIAMPNSSTLWMAAGVLWIMDASINISMEPFRAFVGDMLPPAQRTLGFAMQTFFIGTGAVLASSLPWIMQTWFNVSSSSGDSAVSEAVKYSFYAGGAVFFLSVMYTVFTTNEYPPEVKRTEERRAELVDVSSHQKRLAYIGISLLSVGVLVAVAIYMMEIKQDLYVVAGGFIVFGIIHLISSALATSGKRTSLVTMVLDFHDMPSTMRQLALVQFFTWFGLFAMWIFTTSAVTSHIYGTSDTNTEEYKTGATLVGNLFAMYSGVAAIFSIFLSRIANALGRRATHLAALSCGGLGLISFYFVPDPSWLWISMTGVGIAWASILSMPYSILAGSLPADKMGYYMGIFNFFIVIPQIIAAACLGPILQSVLGNQSILVLVLGGCCMIVAGLLTLRVKEN